MTSEKKRQSIVQVISSSIAAATAGSLIKASFKFEASAFTASGKCATDFSTADELRIGQKGNTVVVEILDHGQVVDSSPQAASSLKTASQWLLRMGQSSGEMSQRLRLLRCLPSYEVTFQSVWTRKVRLPEGHCPPERLSSRVESILIGRYRNAVGYKGL